MFAKLHAKAAAVDALTALFLPPVVPATPHREPHPDTGAGATGAIAAEAEARRGDADAGGAGSDGARAARGQCRGA